MWPVCKLGLHVYRNSRNPDVGQVVVVHALFHAIEPVESHQSEEIVGSQHRCHKVRQNVPFNIRDLRT